MLNHPACAVALACVLAIQAGAAAQPDQFFKGKQISVSVGAAAGGGYDTYARLIARHIGRHIPGNPSIIVSNQPGAGGNQAATRLATIDPKDGTAMAALQSGVLLHPLLGDTAVTHEPDKFYYLGSANDDVYICVARADAPANTFAGVLDKEIIMAAESASSPAYYAQMLRNIVGAKFRIVTGYQGSRGIALAVDRGEAHGACGLAWPSISVTQPDWFEQGPLRSRMRVVLQTHATGHPELNAAGVPLSAAFTRTPEEKAILDLYFSQSAFGRPYVLPPGVPADRAALLRKAFADTMADGEFRAEARRMRLDVDAVPGAVVQSAIARFYSAPPGLIARTRQALVARP